MSTDVREILLRLEKAGIRLDSAEAGPKPTQTMKARKAAFASGHRQLRALQQVVLQGTDGTPIDRSTRLREAGFDHLCPSELEILQLNISQVCNMACKHCHLDAGPDDSGGLMTRETIDQCLNVLDRTQIHTVDITGGAPELNPHFRYLIRQVRRRKINVIYRCNFTCMTLPGFEDLPAWLAENKVEIVGSLPHYRQRNTDAVRGKKAFEKIIRAMKILNEVGYGKGDPDRALILMSNPAGAFLAADQVAQQSQWKQELEKSEGVQFDRLIMLTNMPLGRFLEWLVASNNFESYMKKLLESYNPATVQGLMCRSLLSVAWDGSLYDCDFNQVLGLEAQAHEGANDHIGRFDPHRFAKRHIRMDLHCFGCTAGQGSSCGGALDDAP